MAPTSTTAAGRPTGRIATWLIRLVLAAASIASPAWAADDPPGRVGRVTEGQGPSWYFEAETGEWVTLERNRPITTGDRIAVEGNGRLELRIGSTAVRLAGGSELEIARLDDERIDLYLHDGSVAVRVRSPEVAREVEVASAIGRFWPRGPGHFRIDRSDGGNVATAWSGQLHFDGDDSALDIAAGRSAELWREGAKNATHYSWGEPATDEFADWTARASREDDRVAVPEYVSPEMTGAEDLNRYGTWETNPEYGPLWIPTTVVAGWAPYRYGHWVVVQPWGWTWVDYAPWGFAPFHYGRWVYFGGRWCWAPGHRVVRPVYSPAMVAWIGDGRYVKGPWPYVGWVPLAPREPYYPHYTSGGSYWRAVNAAQMRLFAPGTPRRLPTGPTLFANQGVAGAVSVVPGNALVPRRPVAPVVAQVDPSVRNSFVNQPTRTHVPPPGLARPIAVPGTPAAATPSPRPPGTPGARPPRQPPSPAVMGPPGGNPDWRRSGRYVPPSTSQPPRAGTPPAGTSPPAGTRPPPAATPQQPGAAGPASPRVTLPARPTGPAQGTPPPAPRSPTPAVRGPAQTAPPAAPPARPEPGEVGTPRSPSRSSALPVQPPQARAMPAPAAPAARHFERVAPPQPVRAPAVQHETRRAPQAAPAAQARERGPEWRGHPSREQMR